jgi:hypothetical protein
MKYSSLQIRTAQTFENTMVALDFVGERIGA